MKNRSSIINVNKIPVSIPKKQRARLIDIQQKKIHRQMKNKYFVWEPQSMKYVTPYSLDLKRCGMTKNFSDALNSLELKWLITCYILSRQKNGKNELTPLEFEVKTPCKHCEISDHVADAHWQLIEEFRANSMKADNFITAAWIATEGRSVPEDTAYKLFEIVGAWDLTADWEDENIDR